MSNTKFLIIYLIAMVPTYMWRFAFVGSSLEQGADIEGALTTMYGLLFLSYAIMAFVSYRRGKAVGKGYLVAFPILGGVFDIILAFVPFVPTIMSIVTIILGMPNAKPAEVAQPEASNS